MTNDLNRINALIQRYKLIDRASDGTASPGWADKLRAPRVTLVEIAALFSITNPPALGNALAGGGYCLSRDRSKVNLSGYWWSQIQRKESIRRNARHEATVREHVAPAWLAAFGGTPASARKVFQCESVMRAITDANGTRPSSLIQVGRWLGKQQGHFGGYAFRLHTLTPKSYTVHAVPPAEQFAHIA